MVSAGVVVSGGTVRRSILSPGIRVHSRSLVEGSVLMHDVDVGRGAVVRNAIVDKNVAIPEGAQIGVDLDRDRKLYTVSDNGVVVIGKGQRVEL
jgi:glucose-1-phosphate adenylyltransferase